jgi:glycosyltransferase involved in cell wall biosynthesis
MNLAARTKPHKIAFLAPANSIHTARWVNTLVERGYDISLFSLHPMSDRFPLNPKVRLEMLPFKAPFGYLLSVIALRTGLANLCPDLLHVHYASGYGLLARLTNYSPSLLSVWGSDVFEFPYKSAVNKQLLVKNLMAPACLTATSNALQQQVAGLCGRSSVVVPFGVDTNLFAPSGTRANASGALTVGIVKTMAHIYGIDVLLRAFATVFTRLQSHGSSPRGGLRLIIAGTGKQAGEYRALAATLGIEAVTSFVGEVPHAEVPQFLNQLDIFVAPSRQESFGVSVLEASAAGLPVIVSDAGGLTEVVRHEQTGLIVPVGDVEATSAALVQLLTDSDRRRQLGEAGRKFVLQHYSWAKSVDLMEEVYSCLVFTGDDTDRVRH